MQSAASCYVLIYQNTALHIAAREGHVAAVRLMLARGAEIVLNKNDTSFLHEALQNGRTEVVNAIIDSDRCVINMYNIPIICLLFLYVICILGVGCRLHFSDNLIDFQKVYRIISTYKETLHPYY